MDAMELTTFVERVAADAARIFGPNADPVVLERYAREVVLDLWMTRPRVTVYLAELALRRLREAMARSPAVDAAAPVAGWAA
jgi:hypothetical protein